MANGTQTYTGPVPCPFLIGYPGRDCERCGATWAQHYPKGGKS